jgi:hypothetical protein
MPNAPDKPIVIPLYGGARPSLTAIVGWAVAGNLIVITLSAVFFGLIPFLGGEKPELSVGEMVGIGAAGAVVAIGIAIYRGRQLLQDAANRKTGRLEISDRITLHRDEGESLHGGLEELDPRLHSFYEEIGGQDYYVGPAIALSVGDDRFVLARLDSKVRWKSDPATVDHANWVCHREGWQSLLDYFDLNDELVEY